MIPTRVCNRARALLNYSVINLPQEALERDPLERRIAAQELKIQRLQDEVKDLRAKVAAGEVRPGPVWA